MFFEGDATFSLAFQVRFDLDELSVEKPRFDLQTTQLLADGVSPVKVRFLMERFQQTFGLDSVVSLVDFVLPLASFLISVNIFKIFRQQVWDFTMVRLLPVLINLSGVTCIFTQRVCQSAVVHRACFKLVNETLDLQVIRGGEFGPDLVGSTARTQVPIQMLGLGRRLCDQTP